MFFMKTIRTSLTEQQNEVHRRNALDLATGYPDFPLPESLLQVVLEATRLSLVVKDHNLLSYEAGLERAVGNLLDLPDHLISEVRTTFSGSVALDRVFAAVWMLAKSSGEYNGVTGIVPEPCLDLVPRILKERSEMLYVGVSRTGNFPDGHTQVDSLIEAMERERIRIKNHKLMVVLDSPSNPLGIVASEAELFRLAQACGRLDAVLVIDHCFLLSGIHYPKMADNIFSIPGNICDWIAVWDTGKSIDAGGDKLGFIIPGNQKISEAVAKSLEIIQVGRALRRHDTVFSSLLEAPELRIYLRDASRICRENLSYLRSAFPSDIEISQPEAGTFACVYLHEKMGSDDARDHWIEQGVGVVSGRTFHFETPEVNPFLRISLFRDPSFFRSAIEHIKSVF
jgi:aspartate/methionine/tyrosine aminotransferase